MGKVGYAVASDVAAHSGLIAGMYMFNDADHFKDTPVVGTAGNSGGDLLITKAPHNLETNDTVDIDSGTYHAYGNHFKVERIDANSFKLRRIPANTFVPYVSSGSVTYSINGSNGFYIRQTGSHNEKNFSLGDAYTETYAFDNHNADGTLKYVHGDHGDNYTGPIGDKLWWGFYDKAGASVTDDGNGKALFTATGAHGLKHGFYGRIKFSTYYDGYYFLEAVVISGVRSTTTFRIRPNSTSDYVAFAGNDTATWCIVPGASQMTGLDCKSSDPNNPVRVVTLASRPGQINMRKRPESSETFCFEMWGGSQNMCMDGTYDPVGGYGSDLYTGWDQGYAFPRGKFGVWLEHGNYITNSPTFYFSSGNGFKMKNFEIDNVDGGFCGFMAKNDSVATPVMDVTLEDGFIHNINDGECIYIAETSQQTAGVANTSHGVLLRMSNVLCAYSGAELVQIGQLREGSVAENFTGFSASNGKYNPFTIGQVQGAQVRNQKGGVLVRNFIMDGFSFYGIYSNSDHGNDTPGGDLTFRNFAINRGSNGLAVFYDGGNDSTLRYVFEDFTLKNIDKFPDRKWYGSQATSADILFLTVHGNPIVINNGKVDSAHSGYDLFDGASESVLNLPLISRGNTEPEIEYENSGWDWHDPRKIALMQPTWSATFHITDLRLERIPYQAGWVFRDKGFFWYLEQNIGDLGTITNSGGHALVTCKEFVNDVLTTKNHGLETGDPFNITVGPYAGTGLTVEKINDTTFKFRSGGVLVNYVSDRTVSYTFINATDPADHPTYYTRLAWDAAGKANIEVEHNPALAQYNYPPEDFRAKAGTYHARKNRGIYCIANDPTRTRYEWEWAQNNGGVPFLSKIMRLFTMGKRDQSAAEIIKKIGSGNFVRRKSTPVDSDGDVGATRTESFVQVS